MKVNIKRRKKHLKVKTSVFPIVLIVVLCFFHDLKAQDSSYVNIMPEEIGDFYLLDASPLRNYLLACKQEGKKDSLLVYDLLKDTILFRYKIKSFRLECRMHNDTLFFQSLFFDRVKFVALKSQELCLQKMSYKESRKIKFGDWEHYNGTQDENELTDFDFSDLKDSISSKDYDVIIRDLKVYKRLKIKGR